MNDIDELRVALGLLMAYWLVGWLVAYAIMMIYWRDKDFLVWASAARLAWPCILALLAARWIVRRFRR